MNPSTKAKWMVPFCFKPVFFYFWWDREKRFSSKKSLKLQLWHVFVLICDFSFFLCCFRISVQWFVKCLKITKTRVFQVSSKVVFHVSKSFKNWTKVLSGETGRLPCFFFFGMAQCFFCCCEKILKITQESLCFFCEKVKISNAPAWLTLLL